MPDGQRALCRPETAAPPVTIRRRRAALAPLALFWTLALPLAAAPAARADDGGASDAGVGDGGTSDGGAHDAGSPDLQVNLTNAYFGGGGIGCSASAQRSPAPGASTALFALGALGALLLLRRRRRLGATLGAAALVGLAPQPARADIAVDAIHLRPTLLPGGMLQVEGSMTLPGGTANGGALFSYGSNPLQLNVPGGLQGLTGGVTGQALLTTGLAAGLTSQVTFGIDLPVMLWQGVGDASVETALRSSGSTTSSVSSGSSAPPATTTAVRLPQTNGVGDLRIFFKIKLHDNRHGGLGVAVMPLITAPTGDANSYLGWGQASVEGRLILDYRFADKVLLAANGSFFSHQQTQALNLVLSHELRYGLGALYAVTDAVSAYIEVFGSLGLVNSAGNVGVTVANSPAEGLVGMRLRHHTGLTGQLGAGLGLNQGYGAPGARVFAGLGYAPIADRPTLRHHGYDEDAPPPEPVEIAPPPEPVQVAPPPPVQVAPPPPPMSKTPVDTDGDGVEDEIDRCPRQPGPMANMGCPEQDQDGDGVIDRLDQCPTVPGTRENLGCPAPNQSAPPPPPTQSAPVPETPAPAAPVAATHIAGYRFVLAEPIGFLPGTAVLMERNEGVLRDVARILNDRPDVKVLIEGHTDEGNLSVSRQRALSQERAEGVLKRLLKAGVPRTRVSAIGYGNDRPLDLSGSTEAHERNNRIEIIIRD